VESVLHKDNAICDRKRNSCNQIKDVFYKGKSYSGKYKIDCCGNVWSLRREKIVNNRLYAWAGKKISSFIDQNGYKYISLSDGNKKTKVAIHSLVLNSFVGDPQKNQICRHLDGNPINNCLWNLSWGSYKENSADTKKHGKYIKKSKLTKDQVLEIYLSKEFSSVLAKKYNVASSTIRAVKIKQNWKDLTIGN
jgi:hypothetical protein